MPCEKKEAPTINIRYLFVMVNDVDAMKKFYTDLVGMQEISYRNEEDWAWLVYQSEGFQFMMFRSHEPMPVNEKWTWQPGYDGGEIDGISWSILVPEEDFADTVKRLKDAGVPEFQEKPEWRQDSYWGFAVKDPMGHTVEIWTTPKESPASTDWSG